MANIVTISTNYSNPSKYLSGRPVQIQTTVAIFSAFILTLITTFLILYRIINVTRRTNLPKRTQNTYKHIVDLIIQSSALYSMVLLVWAITWAVAPAFTLSSSPQRIPFSYLSKFIEEICFIVGVRRPHLLLNNLSVESYSRELLPR